MKTMITCPCGEYIQGADEDDLVAKAQAHLREVHDRAYGRDEILFMAF